MTTASAKARQYAEAIKVLEDPFEKIRQTYEADRSQKTQADNYYQQLKPEGKRLILSVDGGGTRGYITLHCLAKLEQLTCRPAYEIFDFYAGTSTGSLIAAGLARMITAHKLLKIYREYVPRIFHEGWLVKLVGSVFGESSIPKELALLLRNGLKYMYSNQELQDICYGLLQDLTLEQIYQQSLKESEGKHTKRILVTAKDLQRSETLFMVNAGPGAQAFQRWRLADAILGSSVAPVFLQPYRVWVDGGVGSYGNPCYVATVEATEYFTGYIQPGSGEYLPKDDDSAYCHENVIHFSFGTGTMSNSMSSEAEVGRKNFLDWILYVISEGQDDANLDQVRLTRRRFSRGNNWYSQDYCHKQVDFRRYQIALEADVLQRPPHVPDDGTGFPPGLGMALSRREEDVVKTLEMNANSSEQLDLMERIGKSWADAVDFTRPHAPYKGTYRPPGSPFPPVVTVEDYGQQMSSG